MSDDPFEVLPIGAYTVDAAGDLQRVNSRFAALTGEPPEQLLGRTLRDVLPAPLGEAVGAQHDAVTKASFAVRRVHEWQHRGTNRYLSVYIQPYGGGQVAVVVDVTTMQQREAASEREARFYRQVFDRLPTPVYAVDREVRFTLSNRAHTEMLGHSERLLIGTVRRHTSNQAQATTEADKQVFASGEELITAEEEMHSAGGQRRWFRTMRQPIGDDPVEQVLCIATDITDYRHAQQVRVQTQESRLDAVGRLAGGVAHDFNSLLTVMTLSAEALGEQLQDMVEDDLINSKNASDLFAMVDDLQQATERAALLTAHLLAFSRRQLLKPEKVDLREVIRASKGVIRRLTEGARRLVFELPEDRCWVSVDRTSIEQVFLNLVSNARDATERGGRIDIMVRATEHPHWEHGAIELVVKDDGIGMPQSTQDLIYEPFFTTKESGTGLGLSTVYGIVKQSGGDLQVSSTPGNGAEFRASFPRVAAPAAVGTESGAAVAPQLDATILVVDDQVELGQAVSRMLTRKGAKVFVADGMSEAIAVVEQHPQIDVFLIDVVMPEANGFEVADELLTRIPSAAVLHMSGYSEDALAMQRQGHTDSLRILGKPFRRAELYREIDHVLRQRRER